MLKPQIDFSESISHRILIVDEDQKFLEKMIDMLTAEGFDCQGCMTIDAAIVAVEAQRPDLILTALQIQGVPGMELCRHVRGNGDRIDVPVMLLSATQMPDIVHRHDDRHGIYYLRRLIKRNDLLELIDNVLPASADLCPG